MGRVRFSSLAIRDIEDAVEWYERQQVGLGTRFYDEMDNAVAAIADRPHSFPFLYRDLRRARLNHFPYGVFFIERSMFIEVVAVMDLRRHPRNRQSRRS